MISKCYENQINLKNISYDVQELIINFKILSLDHTIREIQCINVMEAHNLNKVSVTMT